MASSRRIGSESSATRELIINAAVEVLQEEGAERLTAARIADKAGVKPHLVHYYFRSMEDLVIAVVRSYGRLGLTNAARAIASDEPLRALWDIELTFKWSRAAVEWSSMATHRDTAREELKRQVEEIRTVQAEAITRHFQLRGIEPSAPPLAITVIISSVARQLVREKSMGVTIGHKETVQVMEEFLAGFADAGARQRGGAASQPSRARLFDNLPGGRSAEGARRARRPLR